MLLLSCTGGFSKLSYSCLHHLTGDKVVLVGSRLEIFLQTDGRLTGSSSSQSTSSYVIVDSLVMLRCWS
jgi:hypothetical protein